MKALKNEPTLRENLSRFNVLISGCQASEAPSASERAISVMNACPPNIFQLHLRCSNIDRLEFQIFSSYEVTANSSAIWEGAWCNLSAGMTTILSQAIAQIEGVCAKVLVDLTDADWELGFFVLPMLYANPCYEVVCAFTSPQSYPQTGNKTEHPPIQTRYIRQPPGWMANLASRAATPKHILFLGFDDDRAQKFIENYNWVPGNCIAVFGDPPYIDNGLEISRNANSLLLRTIPEGDANRMTVDAANPCHTVTLLSSILDQCDSMDIILLGTSPMTLGAVWFYLQLEKVDKQRVRFLHDFPQRQTSRTVGVGETWLYSMPSEISVKLSFNV